MPRLLPLLLCLLTLLVQRRLAVGGARALRGGGEGREGEQRVAATLLVDHAQATPGGRVRAGVLFRLDPGWHIYWRNPGEAGLPTEVELRVAGAEVGPLQYPFPETVKDPSGLITTYGHHGEVLLFRELRLPAAGDAVALDARVEVLVCQDTCIPGRLTLTRTLPLGPEARPAPEAPLFERAAAAVPRDAAALGLTWTATLKAPGLVRGGEVEGVLEARCAEPSRCEGLAVAPGDAFVPDVVAGLDTLRARADGPLRLRLSGRASADGAPGEVALRGVVQLSRAEGERVAVEVQAALGAFAPGAAAPAAPPTVAAAPAVVPPAAPPVEAAGTPGVALALVLAFLGGALLNLMPCVFPVLALKVFGFVRLVGGERRHAALHAAAYTLGIEGALGVLALAVLLVRAAGAQVGWGFQFQEPLFVAAVAAVLVVFALNLFGVFTVGGDAGRLTAGVERTDGWVRSAGEGVLAVVLATPCSAPFLGTAVGFALAQPAWVVLGVFLSLGLGLAAPFVLLVLVPQGARRLPRPGAWMERGKQLLGFALLGTAAWLAWVLGQLAGVDGVGRLLAFLVVVGLGTWLWGLSQAGGRRGLRALAVVLVVGAAAVALRFAPPAARAEALSEGWQPYSDAALAEGLAAGRPVFVDFTADWCLTCKYNERTVLAAPPVREAFAKQRAVLLVVDYTRKDARIGEMLARHGRAGVPLYLLYRPEQPERPEVLPELLTEERVLEALRGPPAG